MDLINGSTPSNPDTLESIPFPETSTDTRDVGANGMTSFEYSDVIGHAQSSHDASGGVSLDRK